MSRSRLLADGLLCALAGTLTFLAFPTAWAPEISFWYLIWLSHVPLLWLLRDKAPRQAFWWGLLCGTIINGGGYYWIGQLLVTFGHLPWPVAVLGWLLHALHLGLMWGIWAWLVNRVGNTTSVGVEWTAPAAMVAIEFAYPRIFPAAMGNSQFEFPLIMQVVDLFGVSVITFLIYRVNAVAYLWLRAWREGRRGPLRASWITLAMLAASLIYGGVRMVQIDGQMERALASGRSLKVGMVEGDIGIFERETTERQQNHLLVNQQLSAKLQGAGAELIIWAESAYRQTFLSRRRKRWPPAKAPLVKSYREDIRRHASRADRVRPIRGFDVPLLFGGATYEKRAAPRFEGDRAPKAYNTALLLDGQGNLQGHYDKSYLLMFGEYIPWSDSFPWIYKLIPEAGDLSAGEAPKVLEADLWGKGPVRIGVIICYEGILPAFVRPLGADRPHFIANLTNDDWFGVSAERYLHLALTIPRAIEHRVFFLRATLTGVSAVVDANGRLLEMTKPTGPEILLHDVPLLQSATVYQVIGDAFAWACLALVLGLFAYGRWRRR